MRRCKYHFDNLLSGNAGRSDEFTQDGCEVQVEGGRIEMEKAKKAGRS